MLNEEWKVIEEFERYEISNLGNIRSWANKTSIPLTEPILLKPSIDKNGYLCVTLYPNSLMRGKRMLIHRIVAKAFIPNLNNLPQVNHKDENKANNIVTNLEWCSYSYNLKYSNVHEIGLKTKKLKGCSNAEKSVNVTKNGITQTFKSVAEAMRQLNIPSRGGIQRCLYHKAKTASGYEWEFI